MDYFNKQFSIEFEDDNTLYHYTSIYSSIESIFPDNSLMLSPINKASDPMEHISPNPSVSSYGYDETIERLERNIDGFDIAKKINIYYKSLRQLCLCRNSKKDFEGQYAGIFEPIDYFGFAKPRMWDQYGDKYKGVCIALSRQKLINQLPSNFKLKNVKYLKNSFFNYYPSVDLNEIEKIGEEKYLAQTYNGLINSFFEKHYDYKDENECKLITSSQDENVYIKLDTCIQGIFVTNKLNLIYEKYLKDFAIRYKVPLMKISIERTGLNVYPIE